MTKFIMSNGYSYAYPDVVIMVKNSTEWNSLTVEADTRNKRVIEIQQNAPWPSSE